MAKTPKMTGEEAMATLADLNREYMREYMTEDAPASKDPLDELVEKTASYPLELGKWMTGEIDPDSWKITTPTPKAWGGSIKKPLYDSSGKSVFAPAPAPKFDPGFFAATFAPEPGTEEFAKHEREVYSLIISHHVKEKWTWGSLFGLSFIRAADERVTLSTPKIDDTLVEFIRTALAHYPPAFTQAFNGARLALDRANARTKLLVLAFMLWHPRFICDQLRDHSVPEDDTQGVFTRAFVSVCDSATPMGALLVLLKMTEFKWGAVPVQYSIADLSIEEASALVNRLLFAANKFEPPMLATGVAVAPALTEPQQVALVDITTRHLLMGGWARNEPGCLSMVGASRNWTVLDKPSEFYWHPGAELLLSSRAAPPNYVEQFAEYPVPNPDLHKPSAAALFGEDFDAILGAVGRSFTDGFYARGTSKSTNITDDGITIDEIVEAEGQKRAGFGSW